MPPDDKNRPLGASDKPENWGPPKIEGLPTNKTLVVTKLNKNPDGQLRELRSMKEVFAAYDPSIDVPVTGPTGETSEATIRYQGIKDFGDDEATIRQVPVLQEVRDRLALGQDLLDEVTRNQSLRKDLQDPAKKKRLLASLRHFLDALNRMG